MKQLMRNDPCWCGSKKKYKFCHAAGDEILKKFESEGYPIPSHDLIKSQEAIVGIKESAKITTGILEFLNDKIVAGLKTSEIDEMVYNYTRERGGVPATLNYNGYGYSCCTSINNVICHGMPGDDVLKNGDIVNIDVSTEYKGFFSDSSRMFLIGEVSDRGKNLVEATYECMKLGIEAVKPYRPINDIGDAIETYAMSKGYSVVGDLGGHGIGYEFHEAPHINHFATDEPGMIMVPGMVFTIEPMINERSYDTMTLEDGWTVVTVDEGLSAQWEHTILVTEDGAKIIT